MDLAGASKFYESGLQTVESSKGYRTFVIVNNIVMISAIIGLIIVLIIFWNDITSQVKTIYHDVQIVEKYINEMESSQLVESVTTIVENTNSIVADISKLVPKTSSIMMAAPPSVAAADYASQRIAGPTEHKSAKGGRFNSVASSYW
jgi:hypothetical protein